MNAWETATWNLTEGEKRRLLQVKQRYTSILTGEMEKLGVLDFKMLLTYLLSEMVEMSATPGASPAKAFKPILRYHFGGEGDKFYQILVVIFTRIFMELKEVPMKFIAISGDLLLGEMIEASPESVRIVDGEIFVRRKRHLN